MITITKPTYKCEHCRKLYQVQHACEKHETWCSKNPENYKACASCDFLEKVSININFQEHNGNDNFEKREVLKCTKLNKYLYPLKVEKTGNYYYSENMEDELPNEPMPKECKYFKLEGMNF